MKKLLIIALILWGCDYAPTEHTHSTSVDADWILIKSSNITLNHPDYEDVYGIGYVLFITNSAQFTVDENILTSNNGVLSFLYNEETFNFDLSDSYNEELEMYNLRIPEQNNIYPDRLILDLTSNYVTYFVYGGNGGDFNVATPNELIDYR